MDNNSSPMFDEQIAEQVCETGKQRMLDILDALALNGGIRTGQVFALVARRGGGISTLCSEDFVEREPDPIQEEPMLVPPKNKPYYRRFGRNNRY